MSGVVTASLPLDPTPRHEEGRACPTCGRVFAVTSKHRKQKTCSPACGRAARPKKERRVWTDALDEVVRLGYERGTPVSEIAEQLGMTVVAVALHGRVIGLRHRRRTRTLADRFMDYVSPEPNSGCFLWEGSCDRRGYGQLRVSRDVLRYATHVALELDGRPVPHGMGACHHCDNPGCVNPAHLFVGTQKDNAADMIRKGRGSKPPIAKRGQGMKDFCVRGHPMSGDNLFFFDGGRGCRECSRIRKAARRAAFVAQGLTSEGRPRR